MHRDSCPLDCKVYVGNLGNNGNKTELERSFGYYGPLRSVWIARNPAGFAFVEFEDPRDAADAVRELDGSVDLPIIIVKSPCCLIPSLLLKCLPGLHHQSADHSLPGRRGSSRPKIASHPAGGLPSMTQWGSGSILFPLLHSSSLGQLVPTSRMLTL
uniref:Serine and arginine rich splicing factor 3 n=1 Tax=Erpetoichthys calabaricus TaxID=27687 RepID=A0A8C4SPE3_ERPCA